jgi:hypothetical protein
MVARHARDYGEPPYDGYDGHEGTRYEPPEPESRTWELMLVPVAVGSLVAVSLGAYGRLHDPQGIGISLAGFSGPAAAKAWLATGALTFALIQVASALVMYGKLTAAAPGWIADVHRWSGRIAFLLAVPVAVHCLYALGFQSASPRVLVHSLLGCLFFGAFSVKMLGLRREGLAGWVLPTLGGFVFTLVVGLWLSSSLWFFATFGVQF